jgi:hypothetical protein
MERKMASSPSNTTIESRAVYTGGLAAVAGGLVALWAFWHRTVPIFGLNSIGTTASALAALAGFGAFLTGWRPPKRGEGSEFGWVHRHVTAWALAFTQGAIALLLVVVLFYLVQAAFTGLMLGGVIAAVFVGVVTGIAAYTAYLSAARMTSLHLATTLAVFLVSGALVSMITSPNPYWWQVHFSSLGGGQSASAVFFNLTLIVGGLVIVCLADVVAVEFRRLQLARSELAQVKVALIRVAIVAIGVALACVGLFAYDTHLAIHHFAAEAMAVVFLALIASLKWTAPRLAQTFYFTSYVLGAALLFCGWLFVGVGYFNLTATELAAAGLVFTWLILFVRYIAAGLGDMGG